MAIAKSSSPQIDHFTREPREKIDRIGESPGTNPENPDQQNTRTWTERLEEHISETPYPLGFMQKSPIAIESSKRNSNMKDANLRKIIMVVTFMRSGSSFLGEFFNNHPGIFR